MSEKQVTLDLIADVASPTEIIFEDGESSNDWLKPYDLRLTVTQHVGPNGIPEVAIIGHEDDLRRFMAEKMPHNEPDFEDVR